MILHFMSGVITDNRQAQQESSYTLPCGSDYRFASCRRCCLRHRFNYVEIATQQRFQLEL